MFREYFADKPWLQTMPGIESCQFQQQVSRSPLPVRLSPGTVEILFCIRGSLSLHRSSGQTDRLGNRGILLLSACDRLAEADVSGPLEGVCLCIDQCAASESLRALCRIYDLPITMQQVGQLMDQWEGLCLIPAQAWSQATFQFLQRLEPKNRARYCIMKCFELLYLLYLGRAETGRRPMLQPSTHIPQTAKDMQEFLLDHLSEKLTIQDLSRQFHLSPTACKTCFHTYCGQPIHQWVANQRLERAAQLLRQSRLSVIEVAQAVGYSGCSQFNAAFKKKFGETPSQFRNCVRSR